MEWQQLEYFQTAAKLQHMTLAAEALNISQPALSRSILRLEHELGVQLFDRQGRSIILNRYGQRFLLHVNNIVNEYEVSKREIQDLISPEKGEVSLGFLHTLGVSYIPDLIKGFRKKYPQVNFQLHQNNSNVLFKQLMAGKIDLCMSSFTENYPQIEWTRLWDEELFIIVPSNHPLAQCKSIDLKQIAKEPLITFKEGFGTRTLTDDLLQRAGISPEITFEGEEVHTIIGLVASGLGVALIPKVKGIDRHKLSLLQVKSPICKREIGIARVKGHYSSPAVNEFWQFTIDNFKET